MKWLPGDRHHPPRPDLPVFRHLTYVEIHAIELGAYLGLLIAWTWHLDTPQTGVVLTVAAARKIMTHRQVSKDVAEHDIGFHDAVAEPQYFGFTAAVVPLIYIVATHFM